MEVEEWGLKEKPKMFVYETVDHLERDMEQGLD